MGYRSFGPAEDWDAVREWLEERGVEPSTDLKMPSPNGPLLPR